MPMPKAIVAHMTRPSSWINRSWIAERGPGYFVVELAEPAPTSVTFRYLATED